MNTKKKSPKTYKKKSKKSKTKRSKSPKKNTYKTKSKLISYSSFNVKKNKTMYNFYFDTQKKN